MSVDCNGRFVYLDPYRGAQLAVAEARATSPAPAVCRSARPTASTSANPQRPEIMWQFAQAVEGMGEACRALGIPITGGNVSLYNETDGKGVLPTPVLGVVGLIEDADRVVGRPFRRHGDVVVLLGESRDELGGSEYLKTMHGLVRGDAPSLDLAREAALQRARRRRRRRESSGRPTTVPKAVSRSRSPNAASIRRLASRSTCAVVRSASPEWRNVATLFGESASRVVVLGRGPSTRSVAVDGAAANAARRAVSVTFGGDRVHRVSVEGVRVLDEPLAAAEQIWSTAIENCFERRRADCVA